MADTQTKDGLNLTVLWDFAWNYQYLVFGRKVNLDKEFEMQTLDELGKEEKKQDLIKFIAFIASCRSAHHARLVAARGFSLYKESQGAPQEPVIASNPDEEVLHGHPNTEFPFAIGSMGYIPIIFMELYQIYAGKKTDSKLDFDKIIFEFSDAVVWSIINVFRLEGAVFEQADAGEWAGVSETASQSLLLAGYGFDLLNQLYYDSKIYFKNENELMQVELDIALIGSFSNAIELEAAVFTPGTDQYNTQLEHKRLLVKKQKLLDKKSELFWKAGVWNALYACSLITGASLKLSANSATYTFAGGAVISLGILFIVAGTAANQIKNWAVSCKEYSNAIEKYRKINDLIKILDDLAKSKDLETTIKNHTYIRDLNFQLISAGMEPLKDFSKYSIEKYIIIQEQLAEKEMRAADKKINLDSAWYSVTLTSLGCLTFASGPVGLAVFVFGLAGYSLIKYAYSCKEYYDEVKKCCEQNNYLTELNNISSKGNLNQNEINLALINLGMSEITDFNKTGISNYIVKQSLIIEQKMNAANKKMETETTWYLLAFVTLGTFIFASNPVGLGVLVVSMIMYSIIKYSAKETTPAATQRPLITTQQTSSASDGDKKEGTLNAKISPQFSTSASGNNTV